MKGLSSLDPPSPSAGSPLASRIRMVSRASAEQEAYHPMVVGARDGFEIVEDGRERRPAHRELARDRHRGVAGIVAWLASGSAPPLHGNDAALSSVCA